MKRLKRAYERVTKNLRERRDARERQRREERAAEERRRDAQRRRGNLLEQLDRTDDPERRKELKRDIREQHRIASRAHAEDNHAEERLRELASRIAWGVKRQTTLRRKLREAKAERDPKPEPWHGNGHEWHNLTDRAKKLLAIFVVRYGGYCTSITRGWGTGSFHEDVPTRGWDGGGEAMEEFQRDLRYGRIEGYDLDDLLELFGPDNAACADNGQPYSMAEGSDIERLHDTHVHTFVYG